MKAFDKMPPLMKRFAYLLLFWLAAICGRWLLGQFGMAPYANWEAIVGGIIFFLWAGHKYQAALELAIDEQDKLREQFEAANDKARLFEYVVKENAINERYNLSDRTHPEMYTEEEFDVFNRPRTKGWRSRLKPKPECEKTIELSRQLFVMEMAKLQEAYKDCLESGAHAKYTDENFWSWFEPNYSHPYYYISHFVRTGKDDWQPPDEDDA
jgi:hypothetical protein